MPIAVAVCRTAAVNFIAYSGCITEADLGPLLRFYQADGAAAAKRDEIHVYESGTDLSGVSRAALEGFRADLAEALAHERLQLTPRAAFVCHEPACLPVIAEWFDVAGEDDALGAQRRRFPSVMAAADWLYLEASTVFEIEDVRRARAA